MKKWRVNIPFYFNVVVEVDAPDEESAKQEALREASPSLCHQCSREGELGDPNYDDGVWAEEIEDE